MTLLVTPIRVTLRDARKENGLTQVELAALVGVRQTTISKLELGQVKAVDLALLERICRALNREPGQLLILEPDAPKRGKR